MNAFCTNLAETSSMKLSRLDQDAIAAALEASGTTDLYRRATQAVPGEGPVPALMMLVGEQPGDQEDKIGRPFVGPAGRILDEALEESEIPRDEVYVTNVVKHFKWEPRGKRRLHSKPNAADIQAYAPWLREEVRAVRPRIIVCLGSTAAQFFLGRSFRITKQRGEILDGGEWAPHILATYHPSALLRMKRDPDAYERAQREFVLDLAEAAALVRFEAPPSSRRGQRRMTARGAEMATGR
jgi:DNA polymerase